MSRGQWFFLLSLVGNLFIVNALILKHVTNRKDRNADFYWCGGVLLVFVAFVCALVEAVRP